MSVSLPVFNRSARGSCGEKLLRHGRQAFSGLPTSGSACNSYAKSASPVAPLEPLSTYKDFPRSCNTQCTKRARACAVFKNKHSSTHQSFVQHQSSAALPMNSESGCRAVFVFENCACACTLRRLSTARSWKIPVQFPSKPKYACAIVRPHPFEF